jgi:DNA polymerase-4
MDLGQTQIASVQSLMTPRHRVILHVDMDAFFASIEQRDNPAYRGKPLVVGSPPNQRGVVCAASYEARRFKVRSAMPSRTAAKLCPEAVFVRPRMEVYKSESVKIMAIFESYTSLIEQVSVDEAYLDLSFIGEPCETADEALRRALPLARDIKDRIFQERGLTASIGVASNKFLAKLGSDYQKPNGLTLIEDSSKVEFLRPLSVRSIHGVGPVTAEALEAKGLWKISDLQDTTLKLEDIVGSYAASLRGRAFGEDDREIELERERKSISSEHTFSVDTESRSELREVLHALAEDVRSTLHKHECGALTVQVKVRYTDFRTLTRQLRVDEPVTTARELYRIACHLLATHRLVTGPLRLLGLGVSTLVPPIRRQMLLPLFPDTNHAGFANAAGAVTAQAAAQKPRL